MLKRRQVLVVDDEREIVEMIEVVLQANGYDVLHAYDGEEALATVREKKPDLVILDVVMPKINGFQVCRELKSNEATRAMPVIMLTAKAEESDRFWGKETGADEYMVKPFEVEELVSKVHKFLD